MAKFEHTLYQSSKRAKAFLLYQEPDALGKRRSCAAIANMLGSSASAVAYWKRTDEWDHKMLASIEEQLADADKTTLDIKKTLREGLNRHIKTLNNVIANAKDHKLKIDAIKAFVHIAKELEVLKPDTGTTGELTPPPSFKDDIPHGPAVQASERAPGADPSADGASGPAGEPTDPGDLSAAVSGVAADLSDGSDLEGVFAKLGI